MAGRDCTILTIEDEAMVRETIAAYLENLGYRVHQAENGRVGLKTFAAQKPDLVLVDLRMPEVDGLEVLASIKASAPETPTIVVSGTGVLRDALEAIRRGAWDYVIKPIQDMEILGLAIEKNLERARLLRENKAYQENLETLVRERTAEVEGTRRQIMQRLSRAAEFKDSETGRHVIRVGEIAALLGRAMGFDQPQCDRLRECAPLHDLGKIGIPDAILLKPGPLDAREWEVMKRHCLYGCEILGSLDSLEDAAADCATPLGLHPGDNPLLHLARVLALLHHERWDGAGYPFGLRGEEIPLECRIVSVVDVFDALSSRRPYKMPLAPQECLDILRQGSGSQFDPRVVEAFFTHLEAIRAICEAWKDV